MNDAVTRNTKSAAIAIYPSEVRQCQIYARVNPLKIKINQYLLLRFFKKSTIKIMMQNVIAGLKTAKA
jgi:hypothetical protein